MRVLRDYESKHKSFNRSDTIFHACIHNIILSFVRCVLWIKKKKKNVQKTNWRTRVGILCISVHDFYIVQNYWKTRVIIIKMDRVEVRVELARRLVFFFILHPCWNDDNGGGGIHCSVSLRRDPERNARHAGELFLVRINVVLLQITVVLIRRLNV